MSASNHGYTKKERNNKLINYKKLGLQVLVIVIIAIIGVATGLLSSPEKELGNSSIKTQIRGPYSIVYLNPFFSATGESFVNARQENEYLIEEDIFEITSKIGSENITVLNPVYKEDIVGDRIAVMGNMSLDVSKYSNKECLRVLTDDGNDTGYIIYKMDKEVWISHWRWYGTKQDAWWCEFIIKAGI